ncbi:MAG: transcriptional initiation protein Tat [Thermodesulfobacteriota bacterium]|nr:transcriptional initiation protein Tat [Thermodesulfobacteriota bacterium]
MINTIAALNKGGQAMKKDDADRRSFLKTLMTGSAIAAATFSAGTIKAKEQDTARKTDEILYRESEDFKDYYKSLR